MTPMLNTTLRDFLDIYAHGKVWLLTDATGPVVWTTPGGPVMIQCIEPGDLTPAQARVLADQIHTAADYSEQGNTDD